MTRNWPQWIKQIDEKIMNAQGDEAKKILSRINLRQVPREHVLAVGNLMRRLNLSLLILRLIAPWMQSRSSKLVATDDEKALYAMALSRLGILQPSQEIFSKLSRLSRQSQFFKASALVSQWDYEKAQIIYQNLLKKSDLSRRDELVARINLASGLIHLGQPENALSHLEIFEREKDEFQLLYGNSLELRAQALIGLRRFKEAIVMAKKALDILYVGESDYALYAKKWEIIARSFELGALTEDWKQLQKSVIESGDLETLRDLDFYQALINRDQNCFLKIYFGTPFAQYRRWASQRFGISKIPEEFTLNPEAKNVLDLRNGYFRSSTQQVKFTSLQLRLLRTLTRDFYRPIPLGELFSHLYPDQKFDAFTSPHRLFQSVQNLRKHLRENKIPLQIHLADGAFQLNLNNLQVILQLEYLETSGARPIDEFYIWIQRQTRPFSRQDLQSEMQISRPRAVEWLKFAVKKKWLLRSGAGNHFRYRRHIKIQN